MILGDFNLLDIVSLDRRSGETLGSEASAHFNRWLDSLGVGDAWCRHNPDDRVFSGLVPWVNRLGYIFG